MGTLRSWTCQDRQKTKIRLDDTTQLIWLANNGPTAVLNYPLTHHLEKARTEIGPTSGELVKAP